jgi:flagellar assembly protein FliH
VGRLVKGLGYIVREPVMSARDQATRILDDASVEAERRLLAADRVAEERRKTGFAQGLAEGKEAARAETTELIARAHREAAEVRARNREGAIPLARRMAERIIGRTLELHPSLIADIAAQALAASRPRSGPVTLRVSPADLEVLQREQSRLTARLASAIELKLVADETVGPGGCIIETPVARLDARLDRQLEALERALGQRVGNPRT